MPAILAESLVKTYGSVRALDGVDLEVKEGTVLGVLGPNGAGKTTSVRILTTLLRPDSGRAEVAGIDVLRDPDAVRRTIGVSGQYAAVDEYLTGRENLVMYGRLYQMGKRSARTRAEELLEQFALTDAADRPVQTYSGGMRRRLDLAGALVARSPVLFLDEPTTGLDPRSRNELWEVITGLVAGGTTLLLTTQYLEEADQLANDIIVIDHGAVIARGTPDELKTNIGGEQLVVAVAHRNQLDDAVAVLRAVGHSEPIVDIDNRRVSVAARGVATLTDAVRRFDGSPVAITDIALARPSLDDVFLTLTGHTTEETTP
jgi:ABC-2 type transport system ATP-binding protein